MNWEAIGAVGEILSAVAVLITLVYLAIQIRHARSAQQSEAVRSNRQERREFFTYLRDSPYMPAILAKVKRGEEITDDEQIRLGSHISALWGLLYSEWVQGRLGWQGSYRTSAEVNFHHALAQPGSIEWLNEFGRRLYPDEFTKEALHALESLQEMPEGST